MKLEMLDVEPMARTGPTSQADAAREALAVKLAAIGDREHVIIHYTGSRGGVWSLTLPTKRTITLSARRCGAVLSNSEARWLVAHETYGPQFEVML